MSDLREEVRLGTLRRMRQALAETDARLEMLLPLPSGPHRPRSPKSFKITTKAEGKVRIPADEHRKAGLQVPAAQIVGLSQFS